MNFYASPEYLSLIADSYFKGRHSRVEDVRIDDCVLRVLVVEQRKIVTELPFLDYHEPLRDDEVRSPVPRRGYARWVAKETIERRQWDRPAFPGAEVAPYVDWSRFPTFEGYLAHVMTERRGLVREQERRRRRLEEDLGGLEFSVNDERDDVLPLARSWKSQQLRETGANDWSSYPANVEYLELARERGVLVSSTLRAGTRLLSVWMGFIHDGIWSGWVFAFDHDPRLKKYSVGQQLLRSMLQESHRRAHRQFDFSIGDEGYKWMYATHARLLRPVGIAPLRERTSKILKRHASAALSLHPSLHQTVRGLRRHEATTTRVAPPTVMAAATSPPEVTPASRFQRVKARASLGVSALLMPVVRRAGRAYVGGDRVEDALAIAHRLSAEELPSTVGFWDTVDCTGREVADTYVDAIHRLADSGVDTYLSIKPPALRFDPVLTAQVGHAAQRWNVRVHCDSHGPDVAEASHATERALLGHLPADRVSTTLPGRWLRSLPDADWAVEQGLRVRVVKGQWADPDAPDRDLRAGFLDVIDRLAGRARLVGVATHDVPLAAKAVTRLRAAGTPLELELLYGIPMDSSLRWARDNDVPVRVYVPFGKGFLVSAVGVLWRNPRLAWLVVKDLVQRT